MYLGTYKIEISDAISAFAFIISIITLIWNIVRDLQENKIRLQIKAAAGGFVAKSQASLFFQENIERTELKDGQVPKILFTLVNTGRKPIVVKKISGTYRDGKNMFLVSDGLPKMLHPYEIYLQSTNDSGLINDINLDKVLDLYAEDTANCKWVIKKREMKYLKSTCRKFC